MGSRRKARECALQLMYQLDLAGDDPTRIINSYWRQCEDSPDELVRAFCTHLVTGVWERRTAIDDVIARYSTNWKISRMASVDKNILRLGIYELLYCPDIPVKVTLNEAVEIAKRFGTAESGAFVNGILDNIARDHAQNKFTGIVDERST